MLEPVTAGLDLGDEMLELGPGPGAATRWLRHRVEAARRARARPGRRRAARGRARRHQRHGRGRRLARARPSPTRRSTRSAASRCSTTSRPQQEQFRDAVRGVPRPAARRRARRRRQPREPGAARVPRRRHVQPDRPRAPARLPAGGRLRPRHGLGRRRAPLHRSQTARGKELRMSSMTLPYQEPLVPREPGERQIPEPPRRGEPGGPPCAICGGKTTAAVWSDDNWTLHPPVGGSLPGAVWLASRVHVDSFSDLPEELAGRLRPRRGARRARDPRARRRRTRPPLPLGRRRRALPRLVPAAAARHGRGVGDGAPGLGGRPAERARRGAAPRRSASRRRCERGGARVAATRMTPGSGSGTATPPPRH